MDSERNSEPARDRFLPDGDSRAVILVVDDAPDKLFNKIKHGPQLVVTNLVESFPHARSGDEIAAGVADSLRSASLGAETLRVLPDGANTKLTDSHRATVFLDDYLPAIEQVVYRSIFPPTKTMWWVACWIAKIEYGYQWEEPHPVQFDFEDWATS